MSKGFGDKQPKPEIKGDRAYLNLLDQLLQAACKDSRYKIIYQVLLANQKKLNDDFVRVLREWSNSTLLRQNFIQAQQTGVCLLTVSHVLLDFEQGNYESCLEITIALYEAALTVLKQQYLFPEIWADTQRNLGSRYLKRLRGNRIENDKKGIYHLTESLKVYDRERTNIEWAHSQGYLGDAYYRMLLRWDTDDNKAENAENAIYHFTEALRLYNPINFPIYWAKSIQCLGAVYYYRIQGERADNIEKVLQYCQESLQIYDRKRFPKEWSITKFMVATAYSDRLEGDKAQNIEQAIILYQEGLQECTRVMFPFDWGKAQYNLGENYLERIAGNKAQNIEISIQYLRQALEVYNPNTLPQMWANTQSLLGDAYLKRIQGNEADNIEQAIYYFQQALSVRTRELYSEQWAKIQERLAIAYQHRLQGNKTDDIEQVIYHYQQALLVRTRELYSEQWAKIQERLAIAYQHRLQGNEADNIEQSIYHYQQALLVKTRELYPEEWATIQHNLANVYRHRILGEKTDNIEQAMSFLTAALQVRTFEQFPEKWADSQCSYGNCYLNRIEGDYSNNIEQAIHYFTEAIQIYSRDCFPQEWARIQFNLGSAYPMRIRGRRADNIERGILCCIQSLKIYTKDCFPQGWATTQINLAYSYISRIEGEKSDNIEQAIRCLTEAFQVRTCALDLEGWVRTKVCLGMAYSERIQGEKEENIELSIQCLQEVLSVTSPSNLPIEWAKTHTNLGSYYLRRQKGETEENIEQAIHCCTQALSVVSPSNFPVEWALAHSNLGIAYRSRYWGDSKDNLERSIQHFIKSLQVFTPRAFPQKCLASGYFIADIAFECQLWDKVITGCEAAIDASEILRNWETSEYIRQEIHETATQIGLYKAIVQAFINTNQIDKALEYVERSRSKRLVDIMASNDLYSGGEIPQAVKELLQQYENLQQQIDNLRSQNDNGSDRNIVNTDNRTRAALDLDIATFSALETQKQEVWQQMRQLDPVLAGEIQVSAPSIAQMQELIDRSTTAILSFYTTNNDTHIFILRHDRIDLHTCVGQGVETLQNWLRQEWLIPYLEKDSRWSDRIGSTLAQLAERLQISELIERYLEGIEELIIVPHLLLHQIPFAAIPVEGDRYLGDQFLVRHIPSCQILEFCQQRQEIKTFSYGTVEDAEENLACASFEGEQIAQLYKIPKERRLQGSQEATCKNYRQLIEQVQAIHCCHHAESRFDNPLESRLKLADGSITLGQLMSPGWRLPNLYDVFLSCCETGLGEPLLTDDIFTLSTGFLCAGARTVISTLWSVNDLATALFSIFYYQQLKQGKNRSQSLRQAQIQLRQLNKEDLTVIAAQIQNREKELIKERKKYFPGSVEPLQWEHQYKSYARMTRLISNILNAVEELPFSHPLYWAPFVCQGLR